MRDAAHVVEGSDRDKTETPVKVLGGELSCKRYLTGAGIVGGVEKKLHHVAAGAVASGFGNRGNPCHERLTTLDEWKGQAAGRDGPALTVACGRWGKSRQRNQAARVIGIGDPKVGDSLLFGENSASDLEGREPVVGSDRGDHLDPP